MLKNEVNTLVKKGIQSTMILKKHGLFKNLKNFLTLKLSTLQFEATLLLSVVFIKLKEVVGSKLRAFSSLKSGIEECFPHCFGSGFR